MIANPILAGFHPDPSVCRVDDDFYVATSTFEWYPGVRIHHSRDLRHWRLAATPLDRCELLNMIGAPDSCGVWAPCLSWCDGLFYLVYTDVKRFDGNFKDSHNFLTTSPSIEGPWSQPVRLNSSGFDPSMYHGEDGRKWLLNMIWDHRPDRSPFGGIVMQEYDARRKALVGRPGLIFEGTSLGCTEGPHLYKNGDYYYLMTAEGGTGYGHAITMARSRSIDGPYEPDPQGPLMTARDRPDWPLQRAGHGDLVRLKDGSYYLFYLCSRPLSGTRHSVLGRETALTPISKTDDGWFRLPNGDSLPRVGVPAPDLPKYPVEPAIGFDDFDSATLDPVYQWLRTPWPEEFLSLRERPGFLRLRGMESPGSAFRQALVARRLTSHRCVAETAMEFEPENFQQLAGLICYYNASKFHYLYVSTEEEIGKHIGIMSCEANPSLEVTFPIHASRIRLPGGRGVRLRAAIDEARLTFSWAPAESPNDWREIPLTLDATILSDEAGDGAKFTGAFIGLCCNDLSGARLPADFDCFSYSDR